MTVQHPVLQLISTKSIAILLVTIVGCYIAMALIVHTYVTSLDVGVHDVFQFLDHHTAIRRPTGSMLSFQGQHLKPKALKRQYEREFPPNDTNRIRNYVYEHLRRPFEYQTQLDVPYDIYNCPRDAPPPGYPFAWNVMDVIANWNPAITTEPERLHQSICVFDYDTDLDVATLYRDAELPFLLRNAPVLLQTAERWNRSPTYLSSLFQNKKEKTEHSLNNHFMFFKVRKANRVPDGWTPPMDVVQLTFDEWYDRAHSVTTDDPQQERYYFRANGVLEEDDEHRFLYQELPVFKPRPDNFFMVEPEQQRGINCRFGLKGVIAETHFDESRNFVVVLGGQRRYILAHPRECPHMQLYPLNHPSGRHSAVDWTNPDLTKFPNFRHAQVHEAVLQAGDALYLPTAWFHFIVSLNVNYQCNARSGSTDESHHHMHACGFG